MYKYVGLKILYPYHYGKNCFENLESCIVWSKFPEKLILSTHSQWFFINIMLIKLTDKEIFVINLFKCFAWLLVTYIICVKLKRIVIYSRNNLEFVNEVSKVLSLSRDIHYCKFWIFKKSDFDTCRAMLNSQMLHTKYARKKILNINCISTYSCLSLASNIKKKVWSKCFFMPFCNSSNRLHIRGCQYTFIALQIGVLKVLNQFDLL